MNNAHKLQLSSKNPFRYGANLKVEKDPDMYFSGKITFPWVWIDKQEQLEDIVKVGFYSDFHAHEKDIKKYKEDIKTLKDTKINTKTLF